MIQTEVDRVLYGTKDPTLHVPALTTLLVRVCDGDEAKFKEATRLVALFVRRAVEHP